jgi:hypothetical protein
MARDSTITVFLVEFPDRAMSWCQVGTDRKTGGEAWIDGKGRSVPYDDGKPIHHMQVVHLGETLDVAPVFAELLRRSAETHLLDPDSDQGWITPEGYFFGCRFFAHDDMAHSFFGCHVSTLELEGYVRVHADSYQHKAAYGVEITKRQRKTLEGLGFYGIEDAMPRRLYARDRKPLSRTLVYVPGGRVIAPPIGDATAKWRAAREAMLAERDRERAERAANGGTAPKVR